jgi:hypothetical protein
MRRFGWRGRPSPKDAWRSGSATAPPRCSPPWKWRRGRSARTPVTSGTPTAEPWASVPARADIRHIRSSSCASGDADEPEELPQTRWHVVAVSIVDDLRLTDLDDLAADLQFAAPCRHDVLDPVTVGTVREGGHVPLRALEDVDWSLVGAAGSAALVVDNGETWQTARKRPANGPVTWLVTTRLKRATGSGIGIAYPFRSGRINDNVPCRAPIASRTNSRLQTQQALCPHPQRGGQVLDTCSKSSRPSTRCSPH